MVVDLAAKAGKFFPVDSPHWAGSKTGVAIDVVYS
jgi:hypothetical protein